MKSRVDQDVVPNSSDFRVPFADNPKELSFMSMLKAGETVFGKVRRLYVPGGFFAPMRGMTGITMAATSPVTAPIILGVLAAISAAIAAFAAVVCVGAFLLGCIARPISKPFADNTFSVAFLAFKAAVAATVWMLAFAGIAVLSPVAQTVSCFTRAPATHRAIQEHGCCGADDSQYEEVEEESDSENGDRRECGFW